MRIKNIKSLKFFISYFCFLYLYLNTQGTYLKIFIKKIYRIILKSIIYY